MRAFRRELIEQYLEILPDKFSFTTTATVAMLCDDYKVTYVPVEYFKRVGKSKIIPWDFVSFVVLILRLSMLFNPLKIFTPIALTCILFGGSKLLADVILAVQRNYGLDSLFAKPIVSTTAVILLLGGLQILLIGMMSDGIARKITHSMPRKLGSHSVEDLGGLFLDSNVPGVQGLHDNGEKRSGGL
jgi:hypothetical protein